MPRSAFVVWKRSGESRRLLVIEHPDGSLEEVGLVNLLGLLRTESDDVRPAIEWKDADGVPRTAVLDPDDFGEDGQLLASHVVETDEGVQIWHFDDAALAKIRRSA